jgi:MFS family permease
MIDSRGAPARRNLRPFLALETATLVSAAGNGIALVALPWVVLELTGSAADVGLVAAAAAVPLVLSAFVAGTIVDRFGRRRTAVMSDVLSGVSVAAIPLAAAFGVLSLWLLVALAAIGAVFDPAGVTARETMLPGAAESARIRRERVNGLHEAVFGVAFLVGPALGGLLIGVVGAEATLWATAIGFAISALVSWRIRLPGVRQPSREDAARPIWHDGLEGLAFVWRDRTLRTLTILFTVLVGAWVPIEGVILPVYFQAQDAPERLGIVLMAMSVGGIVGALAYGAVGHRVRRRTAVLVGLIGTALPVVGMAFLPRFWMLVVLGAATGLLYGPINPIANIVLQELAPPHLLGRAIGVLTSLAYAAGPIGFLVVGPLIEVVGLRPAFMILALIVVAVALAAPFMRPLRGLDAMPAGPG